MDAGFVPVVALSDSMNRASNSPASSVKSGPVRFIGPPPRRASCYESGPEPPRPERTGVSALQLADRGESGDIGKAGSGPFGASQGAGATEPSHTG
ncbi:hypothetical protein GCM10023084_75100 [Streptomyces lacrimifluminis]|uniref:Uncharacterized protein n=1 Tax=Streptomyces lacrimifluminis TaxID=1500077 RepID=A0A917UL47_9ACTN|nr:hypothetical protein GCM10012282_73180 [Streptomyces lacrimifluminis]